MTTNEILRQTAPCGLACFACEIHVDNITDDFPCAKLAPLADGAERYPHNLKLYNLGRIESRGLEAWAKEAASIRKRYSEVGFVVGQGQSKPSSE